MLRGKPVENLDKFPASPVVSKMATELLWGVDVRFFAGEGTETLLHDILDARSEGRKEGRGGGW